MKFLGTLVTQPSQPLACHILRTTKIISKNSVDSTLRIKVRNWSWFTVKRRV